MDEVEQPLLFMIALFFPWMAPPLGVIESSMGSALRSVNKESLTSEFLCPQETSNGAFLSFCPDFSGILFSVAVN